MSYSKWSFMSSCGIGIMFNCYKPPIWKVNTRTLSQIAYNYLMTGNFRDFNFIPFVNLRSTPLNMGEKRTLTVVNGRQLFKILMIWQKRITVQWVVELVKWFLVTQVRCHLTGLAGCHPHFKLLCLLWVIFSSWFSDGWMTYSGPTHYVIFGTNV